MEKSSKMHATMTSIEFNKLLEDMLFSLVDLSDVTGIPYRTLQDYKYGKRTISAAVAMRLKSEAKRHQRIRLEVYRSIERRAASEFPQGLISEIDEEK